MAPLLLRERLGHLDPARIASEEDAVRRAVQSPPTLHRYKNKVPGWIVLAARKVRATYGGDANTIWSDNPTAYDLQRRLEGFVGIGQKKAAMAVEILERELDIPIRRLEGSDIAYDVHIRRIFLRSRLADHDDPEHMIDVARRLYPARPGALDQPAWLIGRGWCHADTPECSTCPLTNVCPKDIARAADVTSA
jgi:endonuclease III